MIYLIRSHQHFIKIPTPYYYYINVPCLLSHTTQQHDATALILAADRGHTEVVKVLLGNGAQLELKNKVKKSILLLHVGF